MKIEFFTIYYMLIKIIHCKQEIKNHIKSREGNMKSIYVLIEKQLQ